MDLWGLWEVTEVAVLLTGDECGIVVAEFGRTFMHFPHRKKY